MEVTGRSLGLRNLEWEDGNGEAALACVSRYGSGRKKDAIGDMNDAI